MQHAPFWRSLFFAPANRPDLLAKFGRVDADNYVIDLEDGTPVEHKETARAQLHEAVAVARQGDLRGRLLVRINVLDGPFGVHDLARALTCEIDGIVIPKLENAAQLLDIDTAMTAAGVRMAIVGGIESIAGVMDIAACVKVSKRLRAVYFGAEDLATEMGVRRTEASNELLYARQRVVLAAKSASIAAIDQAVTEIQNDALFGRDAARGRDFGYDGKICLNPRQVGLANTAFRPDATEAAYAKRLLAAARDAAASGHGVTSFEGRMIDAPLIARAQRIVAMVQALGET
ncbi:CoA ester lyase [Paraburkholderia sp. IW21]|uniref:HpcH/HpaI aldolase/citrate lyase family protein n=1 Tax=Paraburkholderia sp. IW21 TaxID=3242488 RepID=UPI003520A5A8